MDASPVVVELPTGEIRTGTRDPLTGDVTLLPDLEEGIRAGLVVHVDGVPQRVTWAAIFSLTGPTRFGVAEPEMPPPNPQR